MKISCCDIIASLVNGPLYRDGRLKPGDELLMVDGKSLVGLSHSEAVAVLKSTQQLVQLVVATEVRQPLATRSNLFDQPLSRRVIAM